MTREWRPLACTIVARNYLPAANVLASSYLEAHPDHRFVVLVLDPPAAMDARAAAWECIGPESLALDPEEFQRMATAYTVTELATAIKPSLLRALRGQSEVVIYLDPDIQVYGSMSEVPELAREHGIVLTPHFLQPMPRDGLEPEETVIMGAGLFNLGFLAIGPGSDGFLDFWAERLRHDAIVAPEAQLFTDQRWVDQVPALFRHHVLRDPGYNVAYWNAHERPLRESADGRLTAAGERLRFFHFSGYRVQRPWLLTLHCARRPRTLLSEHPLLRHLCDRYGDALRAAGGGDAPEDATYGYGTLSDGTVLTPWMRRLFRRGWIDAERREVAPPQPAFGPAGDDALREWLASPESTAEAGAGLSRMTMALWHARPDVRAAFSKPFRSDAAQFRRWCQTQGVSEHRLPEWALPGEAPAKLAPEDEFGVNVLGYLTAELGHGQMGRVVHDAIRSAGVPVTSVIEERLVSNRKALPEPSTVGRPRFPISLFCVNADQIPVIFDHHPEAAEGRYRIGLWAWELEEFPEHLHASFDLVDEVWTVSEFTRAAVAAHATVPVKAMPVPVVEPAQRAVRPRLPGQPIQFLFAFDFNSIGERKNPWGLVEAFQRAFVGRDDVRLVIKAINGRFHLHAAERLRLVTTGDPRIELLERYLPVAELDALYAGSDCYVSLHRCEGFGLTVGEAMARGIPVIATDYSSTTEFLSERVGWPVPFALRPVGPGCDPYQPEALWADPDLDAAAAAMRQVADDPTEAARRGGAARRYILSTRSMASTGTWMAAELRAAYERWRAPARPGADVGDALEPFRSARSALVRRPNSEAPSDIPFATPMRKAMLRTIRHFDIHQKEVLGAVADGVEETVSRLSARVHELQGQLDGVLPDTQHTLQRLEGELASARAEAAAERSAREHAARAVHDLSEQLAGGTIELTQLRGRVEAEAQRTFDMFAERDRRLDTGELTLHRVERDVSVVHEAASRVHAPLPPETEVVLCDAGALLLPRDEVIVPWLIHHRSWEHNEAELMRELMSSAPGAGSFLDVGAHVGYHTLRLLQRSTAVDRVIAVEANPVTAELLVRNLRVNLSEREAGAVTVLPVAAWSEDTDLWLVHKEAENSGDHRVRTTGDDGRRVPAVRLDSVPEVRAGRLRLVKLDLQGRDHRAFTGLSSLLERDRPHVICEFDPSAIVELGDRPDQVLRDYRAAGYQPHPLDDAGVLDGTYGNEMLISRAASSASSFVTLWLEPI